MATYKTEGFIIRKKTIGEAGRLYSIFTKDYGKIEAIADGSSKIASKLAGDLEPFSFSRLMLANGKSCERLAGARLLKNSSGNNTDWVLLTLNWAISEGLNNLTINHLPEKQIYNLLEELQELLPQPFGKEEKIFLAIQFFWLVYYCLGQRQCLDIADSEAYFNKEQGDFMKSESKLSVEEKKSCLFVSKELMRLLFEIDDYYQARRHLYLPDKIDREQLKNFYKLVICNYQIIANRPFNSFQFLSYA